ncbi:DUF6234 family protein [Streptomyces boninensis]|uniref:DUF6234 family protein n=1 Tax=Streptomyces boninensis TaxID=2039455 RepID=UPI003B211C61
MRAGSDIASALGLLVLEVFAVVALWYYHAIASWGHNQSSNAPDAEPYDMTPMYVGIGVIAAVALLFAVGLIRARAPISATVQVVVALALALAAVGGEAYDRRLNEPASTPTSDTPAGSGGMGACRSGGDSHECLGG